MVRSHLGIPREVVLGCFPFNQNVRFKFSATSSSEWNNIFRNFRKDDNHVRYRVFSHDVTVAILVSQSNETAAMLVSKTSPLGVELFSYANAFFCSNKFAYMLATWVKTLFTQLETFFPEVFFLFNFAPGISRIFGRKVRISEIQQLSEFLETFPGNFWVICRCFQIFESFGSMEMAPLIANFRKCCSIRYWKLPKIQTGRFGWMESAHVFLVGMFETEIDVPFL